MLIMVPECASTPAKHHKRPSVAGEMGFVLLVGMWGFPQPVSFIPFLSSKELHREITHVAHAECFLAHQVTRGIRKG